MEREEDLGVGDLERLLDLVVVLLGQGRLRSRLDFLEQRDPPPIAATEKAFKFLGPEVPFLAVELLRLLDVLMVNLGRLEVLLRVLGPLHALVEADEGLLHGDHGVDQTLHHVRLHRRHLGPR